MYLLFFSSLKTKVEIDDINLPLKKGDIVGNLVIEFEDGSIDLLENYIYLRK